MEERGQQDEDSWPDPPGLLDDPEGFASAWWQRLKTSYLVTWYGGVLLVAFPVSLVGYWRGGDATDLIRSGGIVVLSLLLSLNERRKGGSPE